MKLTVDNISKKIQDVTVLNHISLEAESGRIYGIQGRNGSGKTMLFRAISGLMKVDEGCISLDGKILHKDFSVLPGQGLLLEHASMFPNLSAYENLKYLAGFQNKADKSRILETIERVGLNPDSKKKYGKFSVGMKQRLAIAQAIMEKPDIIIMDEPTSGLDEYGVALVRRILDEERKRGAIVLLASHIKEDIVELADEVFTINHGILKRENTHTEE